MGVSIASMPLIMTLVSALGIAWHEPAAAAPTAAHPASVDLVEEICRQSEVGEDSDGAELMDWIRAQGGTVDPRLEVRREVPGDDRSHRGAFARESIEKGQLLFSVPWSAIIHPPGNDDTDEEEASTRLCELIHAVHHEISLAEQSEYAPYVRYLLSQRPGIVPDAWSDAGRSLFAMVKGLHLPPQDEDYPYVWSEHCGLDAPLEIFAAELVLTRHERERMLPLYDQLNHGNGVAYNVEFMVNDGVNYEVRASRDIAAGEQICESYNFSNNAPSGGWYGTPELMRDYGFVEPPPQRWKFNDVKFDLREGAGGRLEVHWRKNRPPPKDAIHSLRSELHRLGTVKKMAEPLESSMPKREWDTNMDYLEALRTAIQEAVKAAENAGRKS